MPTGNKGSLDKPFDPPESLVQGRDVENHKRFPKEVYALSGFGFEAIPVTIPQRAGATASVRFGYAENDGLGGPPTGSRIISRVPHALSTV